MLNSKNISYAESAIGLGVLCFTTINYAVNPIPFLIVSGAVIVTKAAIQKLRDKYDPKRYKKNDKDEDEEIKSKYRILYNIVDKSLNFALFVFSTRTFAFNATVPALRFAAVFFTESIAPAIVTNISDQINNYFTTNTKQREQEIESITESSAKSFAWEFSKFFLFPILLDELPNIPKSLDFIMLKSLSKFLTWVYQNLDLPDFAKISTCLVDSTIIYLSTEVGLKAQALAIEKQLTIPKEVAFLTCRTIISISLEELLSFAKKQSESKQP